MPRPAAWLYLHCPVLKLKKKLPSHVFIHIFAHLFIMSCPSCMISRAFRTVHPLPKPLYLLYQNPTRTALWSRPSPTRIPLRRNAQLAKSPSEQAPGQCNWSTSSEAQPSKDSPELLADALPLNCPGCGAYAQTIEPDQPGYYNTSKKHTRKLMATRLMATNSLESKSLRLDEPRLISLEKLAAGSPPKFSLSTGENLEDISLKIAHPSLSAYYRLAKMNFLSCERY